MKKTTIVIIASILTLVVCLAVLASTTLYYNMNAPIETRQVILENMSNVPLESPYTFSQTVSENSILQFQVHNIGNVSAAINLAVTNNYDASIALSTYYVSLAPNGRETVTMTFSAISDYVTSVSWTIEVTYP